MGRTCTKPGRRSSQRHGAALVLVVLLLGAVFIAVAFSVDVARIQLAQMELQSAADAAARAGAEAMARGVGGEGAQSDAAIRDEIDMVAALNTVHGENIQLDTGVDVEFGQTTVLGGGAPGFSATADGRVNALTDCVRVRPQIPNFPIVFGAFVGTDSVATVQSGAAMVQQRDIVVVLDKSTSMFARDAGEIEVTEFDDNLRDLEDDLFGPRDGYYPHTEFVEHDGRLQLTRRQALKLAVLKFRQEIDRSRGNEKLGLVTYSTQADHPKNADESPGEINIEEGVAPYIRNAIVGNGRTTRREVNASYLEGEETGYRNFDFHYLSMRWVGSTHIADGIAKGVEVLFGPGRRPFSTPILIVMTDGRHNRSSTPKRAAQQALAAHPNLRIYTVSFGAGASQRPMQQVADTGRGTHYHADNVGELVTAFKELAQTAGVTLIE